MRRFSSITTLLLIVLAIYWSFKATMPTYSEYVDMPKNEFSTDRALKHVEAISKQPHGVGFPAHTKVRNYIITALQELGLQTSIQEGYTAGDWGNLSKATNILARIKGSTNEKALVLLTHYDSSPHSSLGASDAGSGVATILESVRAFLSENKTPKNDIIILITDAEELGLNGADLFVREHPWAKEVGLILNFEARGSGGPSIMLMETNRGNKRLIEEFTKADVPFPIANSLAYSIYKLLPNDTDLTVFREDGDIEGFNFAFIGDHYDYHTVRDSYERLDKNTLAHQGSYLMPLLHHFSNADLSKVKSLSDYIYFNVPFFKLISYPFEWIWPMFILAVVLCICLLVFGVKKNKLDLIQLSKGFLPMLLTLLINGSIGYFAWSCLKWMYPSYQDMLHGFTYNGYTYITAFVLLSVAVCFYVYHKFKSIAVPDLLVAPLILWLFICGALSVYLNGASFFIIPVFALLAGLMVTINQKKPNPYLLVFLSLPALWIFSPFVKLFPVGLGLKLLVSVTVLTSLIFYLLLPVFGFYTKKNRLGFLSLILFLGCFISAHFNSGFTKDSAKPSSLSYVLDANTDSAQWATYDNVLIDWNAQYLGVSKKAPKKLTDKTISSKYSTGFTYVADAPKKAIPEPKIETTRDTVIGNERFLEICITPQRNVNRLEVFTNEIVLHSASVNKIELSDYFLENRRRGKLITHYVSNNEYTELELTFPKDARLVLTLYEASNDLLENSLFSVPERPENSIPMPFVLNDAVLLTKTITFE
ncbi:M28 family peptidase [Costertonia aggregata]|uniref:Vacuolar membrane protease n=1 Tax=Costertonia aggregata TaxID=343403 RepID=A0A7H9AN78_9FLAO|nr:M28 family peptidase [Costertonia aggregata]QLG44909.1 M28 family peptidase [Costertonia aggregata]